MQLKASNYCDTGILRATNSDYAGKIIASRIGSRVIM
jgi:hypothetical protein